MSSIVIPASLKPSFVGTGPMRVYDEEGNILGYYAPRREATEEDYRWAMENVTTEEIEKSLSSGPTRLFSEAIEELRRKYGP